MCCVLCVLFGIDLGFAQQVFFFKYLGFVCCVLIWA